MDNSPKIYASFWLRFLAVAVDWIFITIVAFLFRMALNFTYIDAETSLNIFIVFYPFFAFSYNIFCIYTFGATLGKKFAGIQVTKEEGKLTLFETIRREALLKPISVIFLGAGIVPMFFNQKRQTYYDKKFHTVVLVNTPLSWVKRVFACLIGFAFAIYLVSWTPFIYGILNAKNEQMKRDMIYELTQKKDIVEVMNSQDVKEYRDYYKKHIILITQKMNDRCEKRLLRIFDKKNTCTFEDLSFDSLREVDKVYENAIVGFLDLQTRLQDEWELKFKAASQPLSARPGWMRYTDLSSEYSIDYPKTFSILQEGVDEIHFMKNISTAPHGADDYIFIRKGESFQWKPEVITALKIMKVGEINTVRPKDDSLPAKFNTYERLPDISLGDKKVKVYLQKDVWEFPEDVLLHVYLYEGKNDYVFGGLTDETIDNKNNISQNELDSIISTLRFLK